MTRTPSSKPPDLDALDLFTTTMARPELPDEPIPGTDIEGPFLVDSFGRVARSLRVSVTDRCNLRCRYCMPHEGMPATPKAQLASFDEIERLVHLFVKMGVERVKLTGGEPLLRRDLPELIERLVRLPRLSDLSLTTNGLLLIEHAGALADAGLQRLNVSLDSLDPETFFKLTRGHGLEQVLKGLEAAEAAGFTTIKLNVVAIKGTTEQELLDFGRLARSRPIQVRFIEFMPLDGDRGWDRDMVLPAQRIFDTLNATWPLKPVGSKPSQPSTDYRFKDGKGRIGLISSVSHPFCNDCDRIRLTADGKLRNCLFSHTETDILSPLRQGATDGELAALAHEEIALKQASHDMGQPGFVPPRRNMSAIGG